MNVSIFATPELIVTDLTHYLPPDTTAITLYNTCPMRTAALSYAYTHHIPLFELAQNVLPTASVQEHVANTLKQLLSKSDFIIIFSNDFSTESQAAIEYCNANKIPFTAYALRPIA